jgi:hypothetical protein
MAVQRVEPTAGQAREDQRSDRGKRQSEDDIRAGVSDEVGGPMRFRGARAAAC